MRYPIGWLFGVVFGRFAFQKTSVFTSGNAAMWAEKRQKSGVFEGFWVLPGPPEDRAGSQLMTFFAHKEIFDGDTTCG